MPWLLKIVGFLVGTTGQIRAGFVALIGFLAATFASVIAWVVRQWGQRLLVKVAVFSIWLVLVMAAVSFLNRLITSLVSWSINQASTLASLDSSGSWLRGLMFGGYLHLDYLWNTFVRCLSFWIGCHSFRFLWAKYVWAQKYTVVKPY